MIKNTTLLFLLIVMFPASIQCMNNQSHSPFDNIHKPLVYCNHALNEMRMRNITTQDVENILFTNNHKQKQHHGRTLYFEKNNKINPLKIVIVMMQSKNVVVTAYRTNQCLHALERTF